MGRFVKGDIIILPFPFSDMRSAKRRPALVLQTSGDDVLLAQVTSKPHRHAVLLRQQEFAHGGLRIDSHIRVDHLFTSDRQLILYCAGRVSDRKLAEVRSRLMAFLES